MNTIIAGYDPVAVDNVCCRVMGINPDDIEHITLAERAGLGTNNSDDITVVGTTIEATKRLFRKTRSDMATFGQSNRIWLLNGTYSTSGITDPMNYEFVANEDSVAPTAGVGGWSQPIYFNNEQIMLKDYYSLGTQSVVSYAFTYFNAPAAQTAELWVGSDEALKIYINGQVAYNYSGTRTFSSNAYWSEIVSINVKQGINTLLVKAYQGNGASTYNFSLNICEVQPDLNYRGNRILGLKFTTDTSTITSIRRSDELLITNYELQNCYPNPFNPTTTIRYHISKTSPIKLTVYDLSGREVATLVNEEKPAGTYTIPWNAAHLSSGVYFSRLTAGKFTQVKKMMLIK
jgi:hypothetical protein